MRWAIWGVFMLAVAANDFAVAQQGPTPGDIAPPPEIVVPARPEEIPPPVIKASPPAVVSAGVLRPGMFVSGEVELYPRVRVEDANEIHPRAVPMVIAVMDPHEGPWHPHSHRFRLFGRHRRTTGQQVATPIVFVTVMVPPWPPRSVQVQHEEIELNYGDYQVNIDCEEGVVEVEYDD